MAQMLCGDEVGAVVVDIGAAFCKFGSAGQDAPQHVFRSDIGIFNAPDMEEKTYKLGDSALRVIQSDVDVVQPYSGGEVNWDYVDMLFEYGMNSCLRVYPAEFPVMFVENDCMSTPKSREEAIEMLFEKHSSPAAFMGHSGMFSAFCAGRPTSLVVELGAQQTRIVPVVEGYVLRKAIVRTNRGGNWIDHKIKEEIEKCGINLVPWFDKSDEKDVSESFRSLHVFDIIRDVKKWMCFVSKAPISAEALDTLRIPPYELPDGTLLNASLEICSVAESFFQPGRPQVRSLSSFEASFPPHLQLVDVDLEQDSLQELVRVSISKCDVDTRKDLLANITICGGGSAMDGVSIRLAQELAKILPPNFKVKVLPQLPVERNYSAWIGGSILSICGSFQQLWLSKAEYEENGNSSIIHQRFIY